MARNYYNKAIYFKAAFKVGTGPKLHWFVRRKDKKRLVLGGQLEIFPDDGITNPAFQHKVGILIDGIRNVYEIMYVAERF